MRSLIIVIMAVGALVSCGGKKTDNTSQVSDGPLSINMEAYYGVYDNVTGLSDTRRFLIRVDSTVCRQFRFGDSVLVALKPTSMGLQVERVSAPGRYQIDDNEYGLTGMFIGYDIADNRGGIGFAFHLNEAEYEATEQTDSTIIARIYFKPSDRGLQFDRVEVVGRMPRKPVRFK